MLCQACEQPVQANAVKIYQGRKVCPSCFQALMTSDVPPGERHVQIIQTQHLATTVCPECNAEVHIDTKKCPKCGTLLKRIDRFLAAIFATWGKLTWLVFKLLWCFFILCGISMVGGGISILIYDKKYPALILVFLGAAVMAVSLWKLLITRRKK
jgi:ribosomal protein L40E